MAADITFKQSALNMKYIVGEELRSLIAEESRSIREKLDHYITEYTSSLPSQQKTPEQTLYRKIFNSIFLQYISEFVKGELEDELDIALRFNDKISSFKQCDPLEEALGATNEYSTLDPVCADLMRTHTALVEQIAENSIYQDGKVSFSYATYGTLYSFKDIYLSLDDPYYKIEHCFFRSERFIETLTEEYRRNREELLSFKDDCSFSYDDDVDDLEPLEEL